jgi:hypothetical protein
VLEQLPRHKLYLCHEKCEFAKTQIEYLGLIISHGQAAMDPVKIAGVAEWSTPDSKKEVQSFLGFTNFYCQFIKGFSCLARLLFELTRNNSKWHWDRPECLAFEAITDWIVSAPILMFPDDSRPFQVEADVLTSQLEQYSCNSHRQMISGTQWHTTPRASMLWNGTMRSTTRKCWQSAGLLKIGVTSLRVHSTNLRSVQTTKTWSTSCQQRSSIVTRPDGPSTSPSLIFNWNYAIASPLSTMTLRLQDTGTCIPELLVAADVMLHWSYTRTCDPCLWTKIQ